MWSSIYERLPRLCINKLPSPEIWAWPSIGLLAADFNSMPCMGSIKSVSQVCGSHVIDYLYEPGIDHGTQTVAFSLPQSQGSVLVGDLCGRSAFHELGESFFPE